MTDAGGFDDDGPVLRRPKHLTTRNANQGRSRVQERRIAKDLGGTLTRGSGSGRDKGDVKKHKVFRLEAKTTIHKSFSVTAEIIDKLDAAVVGGNPEIPFLQVDIMNGAKSVCVIPAWAMPTIVEALEKGRG